MLKVQDLLFHHVQFKKYHSTTSLLANRLDCVSLDHRERYSTETEIYFNSEYERYCKGIH